jgi:hypothetical protein
LLSAGILREYCGSCGTGREGSGTELMREWDGTGRDGTGRDGMGRDWSSVTEPLREREGNRNFSKFGALRINFTESLKGHKLIYKNFYKYLLGL